MQTFQEQVEGPLLVAMAEIYMQWSDAAVRRIEDTIARLSDEEMHQLYLDAVREVDVSTPGPDRPLERVARYMLYRIDVKDMEVA